MATEYIQILSSSGSDSESELPSVAHSLKQVNKTAKGSKRKASPVPSSSTSRKSAKNLMGKTRPSENECDREINSKETKRRKVEAEKQQKIQERERKKAEQHSEKMLQKAIHKAEMDSRKESQPSERVKQMIVVLETSLTENIDLMTSLLSQLQELSVTYKVESMSPACAVRWKRKKTIRTLNEEQSDVVGSVQMINEPHLLVFLSGTEFVELVLVSKHALSGQSSLESQTLLEYTQTLLNHNPSTKLTLAVSNIDAALRAQKIQRNRQFQAAVRSNTTVPDISGVVEVTRIDCEEFTVDLQITTGCCVRLCSTVDCMSNLIVTYTKALADLPYKKENLFSFYGDLGPSVSRKNLQQSTNKIKLIWEHQLMQFPGVSNAVASAITNYFPSPADLLKAYKDCNTIKQAEQLLSDIEIRRGAGIVATSRRVGGSLSKKIHFAMTCKDS